MDEKIREKIEYALELIRQGREDGVELLYGAMGRTMLFVANGVLRDTALAEDIVQESFIRIVQGIKSYRSGTNGYAWVCRIVRNTAINYARIAGNRRWQSLEEFDRAAECGFEEKSQSVLLVEQLMRELSPERREVIYMKYFLDMTGREIAKEIGKSKSYIAKEICRAEEEMKKKLE